MSRRLTRRRVRRGEIERDGEKLYKLSQLADAANVSIRTVQTHVEKGLVEVRRVGPFRLPRITEKEFKKYIDEKSE